MENEITKKVHEIRELKRMQEELEQQIASLSDEIKVYMTEQHTDELSGADWLVTWRSCVSTRFDQKAFRAQHADLYNEFSTASAVRRFCVA